MAKKDRCRCYINASYNSKTAWRTGRLPKPCPIHDKDLLEPGQEQSPGEIPARTVEQLPLGELEQQLASLDTEIKALEALAFLRAPRAKMQSRQRQIECLRNTKAPVLAELKRRYAEVPRLTR